MSDSEEEEEDDEDRLREELKDLIDDNPIEEGSDSDGDNSDNSRHEKRKKRSDDEDELDDRLEDDDYDLLEENLGVKVQRRVSILYLIFIGPKVSKPFVSAKYQSGNYSDILNRPHSGRKKNGEKIMNVCRVYVIFFNFLCLLFRRAADWSNLNRRHWLIDLVAHEGIRNTKIQLKKV